MLVFFPLIFCYRLLKLKLKESEDLFLTNADGSLKLLPPDIPNQTIKVHSRRLSFVKDLSIYKMFLNPGSLEIKLKRVEEERHRVAFLRSGVKRKKLNPFGFASKRQKIGPRKMGPKEMVTRETVQKEAVKANFKSKEDDKDTVKEKVRKEEAFHYVEEPPHTPQEAEPPLNEADDEEKQLEIFKSILENIEGVSEETHPKAKTSRSLPVEKKEDGLISKIKEDGLVSKIKQIFKAKKPKDDSNYIESDSKLDDDTVTYQIIEVFVSSINKTYFKLKTATNNCVTFLENKFIFAPCINIDNQIFLTIREEEVKKKIKESSELISYEKRVREKFKKAECADLSLLCDKNSPDYDEGSCKSLKEECEEPSEIVEPNRLSPPFNRKTPRVLRKVTSLETPPSSYNSNLNTRALPPPHFPPPSPLTHPQPLNTQQNLQQRTSPRNNLNSNLDKSTALPSTTSLRDIIKNESAKKDFNPDDIIEKLKKSIKTNDFSDIIS